MNDFEKFATAVNCIDGRVQAPVSDWIKFHHKVQYVDMITEPGVDAVLVSDDRARVNELAAKIRLSVSAHHTELLAIAGHADCAANPVTYEEHLELIREAFDFVNSWKLGVRIVGLYVNEWSSVELVADNGTGKDWIKSFL